MSEQIETRRCPGCGGEQEKVAGAWAGCYAGHIQDCPWWSSYKSFDGDVPASSAYADANWRTRWHPKAGDWITDTDARTVFKARCNHLFGTYPSPLRPAWPEEIKAAQEAQTPKPEPIKLKLEVGKTYRRGDGLMVRIAARDETEGYCFRSEDVHGRLWFNHHGESVLNKGRINNKAYNLVSEWQDQPQEQSSAAAQSGEKKPEAAPLSAAPVVPALDSVCADPAMAAFIEDRRAALRKALNAPPAFELGRKVQVEVRREACPACTGKPLHGKYYNILSLEFCPECHGTGYQEVTR